MIKLIKLLQLEMTKPTMYGWFHLSWLIIAIILLIFLGLKHKYSEKNLKIVLLVYGIISFVLEALKQLSWAATITGNSITWHYSWYSAPFQLCTMPIYICLIAAFLKKGKVRDSLLAFLAFFTILGSIATTFYPATVFVNDILINIHTMYLHIGSLVVSIYILMSKQIKLDFKSLINGYIVFIICVCIAQFLNIIVYNSGILHDETFNMFFISPYFPSTLPVFELIYDKVAFPIFLLIYLVLLFLGGLIIWSIAKLFNKNKNTI